MDFMKVKCTKSDVCPTYQTFVKMSEQPFDQFKQSYLIREKGDSSTFVSPQEMAYLGKIVLSGEFCNGNYQDCLTFKKM